MQTSTVAADPVGRTPSTTVPAPPAGSTAITTARRAAAVGLSAGFALMAAGAIIGTLSGVEFEQASQEGTVPSLLPTIADDPTLLNVRYALWFAGMLSLSTVARQVRRLGLSPTVTDLASGSLALGVALAATSYGAFLTVVNATGVDAPQVATALAWFGVHVDWVATILTLAIPVPVLVLFGGASASPGLRALAWATVATGILTALSMALGTGLATWGFALVPVGMVLVLSWAITLWRNA